MSVAFGPGTRLPFLTLASKQIELFASLIIEIQQIPTFYYERKVTVLPIIVYLKRKKKP